MAFDPDEAPGKVSSTFIAGDDIKHLMDTDLEPFSVEALRDRIVHLQGEIHRCEREMERKDGARSVAEALFNSPG